MRWLRAGLLPLSLLVLVAAAMIVPLPLYLERPGQIVPLAACVSVDKPEATAVNGDFLLMTISVAPASSVDALVAGFDPDTALEPVRSLIPPGVDADSYFAGQREVFDASRDIAAAVGLKEAGLPAEVTGDGVSIVQVAPDTPAAATLEPGDIITAIDGNAVTDEAALREAVASATDGEPLSVRVTRRAEPVDVKVTPEVIDGAPRLGVIPETVNPRVSLPVAVDVTTGPVGGPSAGLMIALTVYDSVLPGVDLAAGRTVAGTGTIDQSGVVGPVGGAGLKVIAAHRSGAAIFLAPRANLAEARAALPEGSSLKIVGVETFSDAREALESESSAGSAEGAARKDCPYGEGG